MSKTSTSKIKIFLNFRENIQFIIITIIAVTALILSIFSTTINLKNDVVEDVCYKVYVGLTDSNLGYQKLSDDIAKEMIKSICIEKNVPYTIYFTDGAYKDKKNLLHVEKSMVVEFDHIDEKKVKELCNAFEKRLNTGSVMIQKMKVENIIYKSTRNKQ